MITGLTDHGLHVIVLAIAMSTSLYHSFLLEPYCYIYGTLPPDCFETRVAMIPVNQTDKACRSSVGQDLIIYSPYLWLPPNPLLIAKKPSSVN